MVFPGHGSDDIAGLVSIAAGHILRRRNQGRDADARLELGNRLHDAEHGRAARHVRFHLVHVFAGLDGDAAAIKGNSLPD